MNSDRIERVKGDVFDHSLQESLGLDGLILQVRHGFNPVDVAWRKYMKHPNMRIDANTGVFVYNDGVHKVPTREEFPSLIAHELDTLVGRGARRIGMNPLWFQDENGERRGGHEADELLDNAILSWLSTSPNANKVDKIFVIDLHGRGKIREL